MQIKTKKTMSLPQLIEWAWENGIKNKGFESERTSRAYFDYDGYLSCTRAMEPTDTFTVEVEEEITEDTVIPKIVSIGRKNENEINIHHYCRISQFIDNKDFNYYVLNDDDTLTLIWCDEKLVE